MDHSWLVARCRLISGFKVSSILTCSTKYLQMNIFNIFKTKPSKEAIKIIKQSNLMISRLNDEFEVGGIISLLKKDYQSFEDEIQSVSKTLLLLAKRVEEHKQQQNIFPDWFELRLERTSNHLFSIFNYLNAEDYNSLERFIIDFYKEKELTNEPVFDIRDKFQYSVLL